MSVMSVTVRLDAIRGVLNQQLQACCDKTDIELLLAEIEKAGDPYEMEEEETTSLFTPAEQATRAAREEIYGDPLTNHLTIGRMWAGLIQQSGEVGHGFDLPPHLVCLMQVAVKLNRLARSPGHKDSYHDAHVYLKLAEEIAERESQG